MCEYKEKLGENLRKVYEGFKSNLKRSIFIKLNENVENLFLIFLNHKVLNGKFDVDHGKVEFFFSLKIFEFQVIFSW